MELRFLTFGNQDDSKERSIEINKKRWVRWKDCFYFHSPSFSHGIYSNFIIECYEYSRIFRENVALFTLKKKSSESNLYLWKSEKKIVVTSTRVILRKTDFFRFSPRNSQDQNEKNVSDLTYLTEFITVCIKEKQRSNVHVVIYVQRAAICS